MLKPLREAVASWSPTRTAASAEPLAVAVEAWPSIVGAESARNSRPLRLTGDTLVVLARSSAWSEQLSFLAERILAALSRECGLTQLRRLHFRTGTISERVHAKVLRGTVPSPRTLRRTQSSASAEEAVARFRARVARVRRARAAAGSKECQACATLVAPGRAMCAACENRLSQDRERLVSRLLFDVPWLGFEGVAALVDGLQRTEYEAIRLRLLARWWTVLDRARRTRLLSRDYRERLIASSYVIVKSGLEPERIAPATVRDLLGDELTELLHGTNHE